MSRVSDLFKGALELNLRYTSTLLNLSKEYLRDANVVLTNGIQPAAADPAEAAAAAAARPPLLIVGRAGDTGNGAFAVNNPRDSEISVHFVTQGELGEGIVSVDPVRLTLQPHASAIVRILAHIDDNLPVDRDHVGSVVAPGLSTQGIPFIVRRLPDSDARRPSSAKAAPPKSSGRAKR
jgi:hypothetical protein